MWGSKSTSHTSPARSHGAMTRIFLRDHRSMNTPVNGPMIEKGSEITRVAMANPVVVLCLSGENTTDATSEAWNNPSAD